MSSKIAHKKLKESFNKKLFISLVISIFLHAGIFILWPDFEVDTAYISSRKDSSRIINISSLPNISIPQMPEKISKPATPKEIPNLNIDDITIKRTTFEENPLPDILPPPTQNNTDKVNIFSPRSIAPYISNKDEIIEALRREYPNNLNNQGIGGVVVVEFLVSKDGEIRELRVFKSSGYTDLDKAALSVMSVFEFNPALNMDKPVDAWVRIPIRFVPGK